MQKMTIWLIVSLKKSKKKSKTLILLFILYLHLSLHKVDQDVLQYKLLKFKETDEVSFLLYINLFITYYLSKFTLITKTWENPQVLIIIISYISLIIHVDEVVLYQNYQKKIFSLSSFFHLISQVC